MIHDDQYRNARSLVIRSATIALGLALATLCGCSSSTDSAAAANAKQVEVTFDLSQCQSIDQNMYKCPAVDKPICKPEYNPGGVECIKIGKKGSVYVTSPSADY